MRRRGFTLIEVMVAVAILGLGLASLFTSQVGAIKIAQRARTTTVATLLARCKMAEIEEVLMVDGLPFDDLNDRDECCEDAEQEGYECEWSVERIVLPDESFEDEEEGAEALLGGGGGEGSDSDGDAKESAVGEFDAMMSGDEGAGGGIMEMLTGITFPVMKPVIEERVRRATVTVRWDEGNKTHEFDVVQFVSSEKAAVPPDPDADPDEDVPPP